MCHVRKMSCCFVFDFNPLVYSVMGKLFKPICFLTAVTPSTFETPDGRNASPSCSHNKRRAARGDEEGTSFIIPCTVTPHTYKVQDILSNNLLGKDGDKAGEKELPSLDRFLAKNTSEDNASFEQIMELAEDKEKLRHSWLYDAENEYREVNQKCNNTYTFIIHHIV